VRNSIVAEQPVSSPFPHLLTNTYPYKKGDPGW
jgi:hypothetical protein